MKWNKWKDFSIYKSEGFEIRKCYYSWYVYYCDKCIGERNTLKEAKVLAENYNK